MEKYDFKKENLIFNNAVKSIMNVLTPPEALLNYNRKFIFRKYRIKKCIKKRYLLIYNPVAETLIDNYLFSTRLFCSLFKNSNTRL